MFAFKKSLISLFTVGLLTSPLIIFSDNSQVLNNILDNTALLHKDLQGLSKANANNVSSQYRDQMNLGQCYAQTSALMQANHLAQTQTDASTQSQVTSDLTAYSSSHVNTLKIAKDYANLPASDSLTQDSSSTFLGINMGNKKTDTSNDPSFNFGTLINSTHYPIDNSQSVDNKAACDAIAGHFIPTFATDTGPGTCQFSKQYQQAQNYMAYLIGSYQPVISGVNFYKINNNKAAIDQLNNNVDYINFKNKMRNMITARSMALDNFNQLIQERMQQPGLGAQIGMTDQDGKVVKDASPLEAQDYLINSKLNNPKWYRQLATASSTSIQRQTLVAMLGIQHQLLQQHLDNERLIATESAMTLSLSNLQKMLMQSGDVQKVNDAIDKAAAAN